MHICYADDSGDEYTRMYSVLTVPVAEWKSTLAAIKNFRRQLKGTDKIFVTAEFHARFFVSGRGRIAPCFISKQRRCEIFNETLEFVAGLPGVRLFNAACSKAQERTVFERLLNRINRTMKQWGSEAFIISDEGKDFRPLVRRMGIYNPIPSAYGAWPDGRVTRNIPLDLIIEDLMFRDSEDSYFIQLADFCAYALLRSEKPLASKNEYGLDKSFELLRDICTPECHYNDPRKLGIIRGW